MTHFNFNSLPPITVLLKKKDCVSVFQIMTKLALHVWIKMYYSFSDYKYNT